MTWKITVVVPKKCDVVLGNQVYKVEAGGILFKIKGEDGEALFSIV